MMAHYFRKQQEEQVRGPPLLLFRHEDGLLCSTQPAGAKHRARCGLPCGHPPFVVCRGCRRRLRRPTHTTRRGQTRGHCGGSCKDWRTSEADELAHLRPLPRV